MPVLHEEQVVRTVVIFGGAQLLGAAGIMPLQRVAHVGVPSHSEMMMIFCELFGVISKSNMNMQIRRHFSGKTSNVFIPVLERHPLMS